MLNTFPNRVPYAPRRGVTVPKGYYYGHPSNFDFKQQKSNYEKLVAVLEPHGLELSLMSACPRHGADDSSLKQMRFVVIAGDVNFPQFIWEKYEGNDPKGAQNYVYVSGKRFRTSEFLWYAETDPFKVAILLTETTKEREVRSSKLAK